MVSGEKPRPVPRATVCPTTRSATPSPFTSISPQPRVCSFAVVSLQISRPHEPPEPRTSKAEKTSLPRSKRGPTTFQNTSRLAWLNGNRTA
jgi:hypothetical protein